MTIAESLLMQLRQTEGLSREFLFGDIARDYGDGFARAMREKFEESERKKSGARDER
jgi:hypothetical protein